MSSTPPGTPPATALGPPHHDGASYVMEDSMGHQLAQLMLTMRREVELRMAEHGLTDAQWKPLWLLKSGKATTPQELSRCTLSDAGAMTRLLDRLVAKGLVERERSDTDRRVVQLRITPAGEAAAAHVPHVLADLNNLLLQGFSADDWQQLRALVARMTANYQALHDNTEEQTTERTNP